MEQVWLMIGKWWENLDLLAGSYQRDWAKGKASGQDNANCSLTMIFCLCVSVKVLTDGWGTKVMADSLPPDYGDAFRRLMLLSIAPTRHCMSHLPPFPVNQSSLAFWDWSECVVFHWNQGEVWLCFCRAVKVLEAAREFLSGFPQVEIERQSSTHTHTHV